jgi:hypothetical protein
MLQTGSENRQLIFLYERGKKKLMDGTRVVFSGKDVFNSTSVQLFHRTIMHNVTMFVMHRLTVNCFNPSIVGNFESLTMAFVCCLGIESPPRFHSLLRSSTIGYIIRPF